MMLGQGDMIKAGYRWDVFAYFPCNASGVRVAVRKTKRGAVQQAARFTAKNRVATGVKLRHDPLLDDVMNARKRRR